MTLSAVYFNWMYSRCDMPTWILYEYMDMDINTRADLLQAGGVTWYQKPSIHQKSHTALRIWYMDKKNHNDSDYLPGWHGRP